MARPKMNGLLYFPFDIDFFEDNKIRILRARYRSDGIHIYIFLLCEIYKNGYYIKVDEDFEYIIADELGVDQNKVKQVLKFLSKRSMFDNTLFDSDNVLTSAGIQRRYQLGIKERFRKSKESLEVGRYWLLSREETEPFIKCSLFEINPGNKEVFPGKTRKIPGKTTSKESKVNNNIYIAFPPELEKEFQLYLLVRQSNYGEILPEQVQALRDDLTALTDNLSEQIAIVKKAAASGWKSFYKTNGKPQRKQKAEKKSSKFSNFPERSYDADLEKELIKK